MAVADKPEGPFVPQAQPIRGSMSIDPSVFKDDDGQIYVYFGGLWGGQLQWYQAPQKLVKEGVDLGPAADKKTQLFAPADVPALPSFVVLRSCRCARSAQLCGSSERRCDAVCRGSS